MQAVWSFWTKPFQAYYGKIWFSETCHLFSWILSFHTAREHFERTALFTDEPGARMLVDGLGLEFDVVSVELDALDACDPKWWALGKIYTYRAQKDAFIHVDSDVYLWKRPQLKYASPLIAQNPEYFVTETSCYMPEQFEMSLRAVPDGWLPAEWVWYRSSNLVQRAVSCGIFGGTRTDFIQYFANLAIRFIEHPSNRIAWNRLEENVERNILAEQYLLSACIEYHKRMERSPFHTLDIQYLFDSLTDALDPSKAKEAGYTHLIASAKKSRILAEKLEKRVKTDYPVAYDRCMKYMKESKGAWPGSANPR